MHIYAPTEGADEQVKEEFYIRLQERSVDRLIDYGRLSRFFALRIPCRISSYFEEYLRGSEATRGCISIKGSFFEVLSQTKIVICGANQRFSAVIGPCSTQYIHNICILSDANDFPKAPATVATSMPFSSLRTGVTMPAPLIQQGVAKERTERNGHLEGSLMTVILWLPVASC